MSYFRPDYATLRSDTPFRWYVGSGYYALLGLVEFRFVGPVLVPVSSDLGQQTAPAKLQANSVVGREMGIVADA